MAAIGAASRSNDRPCADMRYPSAMCCLPLSLYSVFVIPPPRVSRGFIRRHKRPSTADPLGGRCGLNQQKDDNCNTKAHVCQ